MPVTMKGANLCIDKYLYERRYQYSNGRVYWLCIRSVKKKSNSESGQSCHARAVTTIDPSSNELVVQIGPAESKHNHPPDTDDDRENQIVAESAESPEAQNLCKRDVSTSRYCVGEGYCIAEINKRIKMTISMNDPTTDRKICLKISDKPIVEEENKKRAPGVIILGAANCNLYAYATVFDEGESITKDVDALQKQTAIPVIDLDSSDEEERTSTDNTQSEPMFETPNRSIRTAGDLIEKFPESIEEIIQSQEKSIDEGGEVRTNVGIDNISPSQPSDALLENCPNFQPLTFVTDRESGQTKVVDLVDLNDSVVTMHQLIMKPVQNDELQNNSTSDQNISMSHNVEPFLQSDENSNDSDSSLEPYPIVISLSEDRSEISQNFLNSQFGTSSITHKTNSTIVDQQQNDTLLYQEPDTSIAAIGRKVPLGQNSLQMNDDGQNDVGKIHVPIPMYPPQIMLTKVINDSFLIPIRGLLVPEPPSDSQ